MKNIFKVLLTISIFTSPLFALMNIYIVPNRDIGGLDKQGRMRASIEVTTTVGGLKRMVNYSKSIPIGSQTFRDSNRRIMHNDNISAWKYGVREGSTIYLDIR